MNDARRKCFVAMPFGTKDSIDFDAVFRDLIRPAVECELGKYPEFKDALGLECIRADNWNISGSVHREMIQHIVNSDVMIVDITTNNANVFYELGIRHSFRQYTTVLIRKEGERIPFNIAGMRVVDYAFETPEALQKST